MWNLVVYSNKLINVYSPKNQISYTSNHTNKYQNLLVNFLQNQAQLKINIQDSESKCIGNSPATRICRLKNILVFNGKIYFVTKGENDVNPLPPIETKLREDALLSSNPIFQFKRSQETRHILSQQNISQIDKIPKAVIWTRNSGGPHIYHNTIDDSSIFFHHICKFYGYCDYDPKNRTDVYVIYSDGYKFKESAQTEQIWGCFTPNYPIRPNFSKDVLYVVDEAIVGVGEQCMHFYHCNQLFTPKQQSWFSWEMRDMWIKVLRQCIMQDTYQQKQSLHQNNNNSIKQQEQVVYNYSVNMQRENRTIQQSIYINNIEQKIKYSESVHKINISNYYNNSYQKQDNQSGQVGKPRKQLLQKTKKVNYKESYKLQQGIITPKQNKKITIINREKQFHRSFINVDEIVHIVQTNFPNFEINLVYMENLTLTEQALEVFGSSKLVIAMHGAALTNILYMRNCSAVVSVFPFGYNAKPHSWFHEPYIFGNIGVTHHVQNVANVAFFSYHIEHMSQMELDYEMLHNTSEFINLTLLERKDFMMNGICPERYKSVCQYYWLHRTADVYVNTTKLLRIVEIAMSSADQCLSTAYSDKTANENGRWMLADCLPPSLQDLNNWKNEKGRLVSPSAEECCSDDCNAMYGWLIGSELSSFRENNAQSCCQACQENEDCNAWNYCPCLQGCDGYPEKTCVLKKIQHPDIPQNITEGIGLTWLGGAKGQEGKIYPHWKCGKHENGLLDCVTEDCHTVQGLLKHPKLKSITSISLTPQLQNFSSVSPARCCELCKGTEGCNVWSFCNNPLGCGSVKPFTCFMDQLPDEVSFSELQIELPGSFSSKVSGYISAQKNPKAQPVAAPGGNTQSSYFPLYNKQSAEMK